MRTTQEKEARTPIQFNCDFQNAMLSFRKR